MCMNVSGGYFGFMVFCHFCYHILSIFYFGHKKTLPKLRFVVKTAEQVLIIPMCSIFDQVKLAYFHSMLLVSSTPGHETLYFINIGYIWLIFQIQKYWIHFKKPTQWCTNKNSINNVLINLQPIFIFYFVVFFMGVFFNHFLLTSLFCCFSIVFVQNALRILLHFMYELQVIVLIIIIRLIINIIKIMGNYIHKHYNTDWSHSE